VIALCLGKRFEAHSLRQILTYESVSVFVSASLPRVIGSGEVEFDAGTILYRFVVVELGAIVKRDGVEASFKLTDGLQHRASHFGHVACFEFFDDQEAGDALDECEDAVSLVGTHDGVAFPVALLLSQFDLFGTLTDMSLSEQTAACGGASAAFPTEFTDDP